MFNKRIKLILRSKETGKKIETIKFSKSESKELRNIANILNMSEEQMFNDLFDTIIRESKFKKPI